MDPGPHQLVIVANRLPADVSVREDGSLDWRQSPGGLVTAMQPVVQASCGAWVGWTGSPDFAPEPFEANGMSLYPVPLNEQEIEDYYEGFSNATLWPLYHDVITPPEFHREWNEAYRLINRRFAEAAAAQAAEGATIWVHDYQLQLVPQMIRRERPDVRIGFFNHIPFPPYELFAQLPWRRAILTGLVGADLIGFQRSSDATNFLRCVRRITGMTTRGQMVSVADQADGRTRYARAASFPISIDTPSVEARARQERVHARSREIRAELGDPNLVIFGVDRLDYTKGIRHRLKAYGELLQDGRLTVPGTVLVQVASPSRENVEAYQTLRDEVETTVSRINGDFGSIGQPAVQYLHQNFPVEEMAALYQAADIMLVTSLRDGMNLVAKEYIASRVDTNGTLVLSEFTGAADELVQALMVNPHDIDGMKDTIMRAALMDPRERRRRMRSLRRRVSEYDVKRWAHTFLEALEAMPQHSEDSDEQQAGGSVE